MTAAMTPHQRTVVAIHALTEAVRSVEAIPSGTLYANVCGSLSFDEYLRLLGVIERSGLVTVGTDYVVRWTGPRLGGAVRP